MNKPCPFCGSEKTVIDHTPMYQFEEFWVMCKSCGCEGPMGLTEKMAWDLWNERKDAHDEETKN